MKKAEVKELLELLERLEIMSSEELVDYMTDSYNYASGEGTQEKPNNNYYEITDDYMIEVYFDDYDILKAFYSVEKDEREKDLEKYDVEDIESLADIVVENADREEIRDFYQYNFDEIDRELLREYLEKNRKDLIEEVKEEIERLEDED